MSMSLLAQRIYSAPKNAAGRIKVFRGLANWAWDNRALVREIYEEGDGAGDIFLRLICEEAGICPTVKVSPRRISYSISARKRLRIYERDGYECLTCGARKDLTIDHVRPQSKGGSNEDSNLQTLCRSCNCSKGART